MRGDQFWLSDEQFAKIKPLLPTDTRGKERVDDRRVISGIVHVSDGRWVDAPPDYGPRRPGCRGRKPRRFDLGGVVRDRPDDASPERTLDQRGVDLVWQRAAREFGNARENVASEGTCERRSQPRMRRRDLSTSRRSIRALVVGTPRTAWPRKLGRGRDGPRAAGPAPWAARERRLRGRSRRAW